MAGRELDLGDLLGGPRPTFDLSISLPLAQPHEAVANLDISTMNPETGIPSQGREPDALREAIQTHMVENGEPTSEEPRRPGQRWQPPAKTSAAAGRRTHRYGRGHRSLRPF